MREVSGPGRLVCFSLTFHEVLRFQLKELDRRSSAITAYTAIPYRESTGFLQGIPCVVFPPLHALAVYRV